MSSTLRRAAALAALCAAVFGIYQLGLRHGRSSAITLAADPPGSSIAAGEAATKRHIAHGLKAGDTDPASGRKILYYRDPMVPDKHFDAPAKSPFMDMMLVPVYSGNDDGSDDSTVTINPRVQQNLGLRTAEVAQGHLQIQTSAVGRVARTQGQVLAELPESQAARVRPGTAAEVRAIASPGEVFRGQVQSFLPDVAPRTRTRQARIQFANPLGALVPGTSVTVRFTETRSASALLIPTEALIQTGLRSLVMRADGNGHFAPVVVEAGLESNGQTEIKRGLKLGQRVVVSGQFLIDSEASLKGVEARPIDVGGAKP